MRAERQVFVISDLHLGGKPDLAGAPDYRLFTQSTALALFIHSLAARAATELQTELVINGDFVDFLAEPDQQTGERTALKDDPQKAVRVLEKIAKDEAKIFAAIKRFLGRGHRLTLLLGNHDIELSFPLVRAWMAQTLGTDQARFQFLMDGEAYVLGDIIIEHGNRYDDWNRIDFDALRRARSLQSRRLPVTSQDKLSPCPGSEMVATIVNDIKKDFQFINLLKPEDGALVPILLAIQPSYRAKLLALMRLVYKSTQHRLRADLVPARSGEIGSDRPVRSVGGDLAGGSSAGQFEETLALSTLFNEHLGGEAHQLFVQALKESDGWRDQAGGDIAFGIVAVKGLLSLIIDGPRQKLGKRLDALRLALASVELKQTFAKHCEPDTPYRRAAVGLSNLGFRLIIFGHTHVPKDVNLETGARYLNTGTWANSIRFRSDLLLTYPDKPDALESFVRQLTSNNLENLISFEPTYAQLDLDNNNQLIRAQLFEFDSVKR